MLRPVLGLGLSLFLLACGGMHMRPDGEALDQRGEPLPLKRVRLYASGVGYFERSGRLRGDTDILPVPSSHLDDALKSLVLLSPGGVLGSVSFPSRLSPAVARARAGLPAEEETALSYDRLLVSLRGEQVEVHARGKQVRGRVVEVVAVKPSHPSYLHRSHPERVAEEGEEDGEEGPEVLQFMLLAESGELLRFEADELDFVRPLHPLVRERLEAALSARLSLRSNRRQALALGAARDQDIALGYLAETPVWRPS